MLRTSIPIRILDINGQGFHLLLGAEVNGRTVTLVLDTGASRTVFDINFLREIIDENQLQASEDKSAGLGTNDMESHFARLEKFRLGRMELIDLDVVGIDLATIRESYAMLDLPEVQGVLGGDILREYHAVIDYGRSKLMLRMKEPST